MEIVFVYQKKRKEFGKQTLFRDKPSELTVNILPDPQYMSNYIAKNPSHTASTCISDMSEHEANTESHVVASRGILHKEGGWPKDVDSTDVEHVLRYRKKVEKDEEYLRVIKSLSDKVEHYIKQNNSIDIYEEYFTKVNEDVLVSTEKPSAKTLNIFRDPNAIKRAATNISWYPDTGKKIAIAYSNLQFQQTPTNMTFESYIWDIENPNVPDQSIIPVSQLVCLKYNPKDSHMLIGGMYNGSIGYWDTRKGPYPCETSLIEKSHREPVTNLAWQNSKTGAEFFSTSTDGQVLWWDARKLSEPTECLLLDPERNGVIVGGTTLDFETTMPTKFVVGSENGSAFLCNKKSKTPAERITHIFPGHHGPLVALQRNPFFPKNFLTAGDWSAKIWIDDIKFPIMNTKYHHSYLTDASWSPTRPAVFCTGKMDGTVDFWDLIFKQNDPTLTIQVCNVPIKTVKIQDHGKWTAVGASNGTTTLIEISDGLAKMQAGEKATFSQMLEREAKREKTLEGAAKEKRLKAQLKRPGSARENAEDSGSDAVTRKAEEEFFKTVSGGTK